MPGSATAPMRTPQFVVSAGRCGSTLVTQALALHPEALSLSEAMVSLGADHLPEGPIDGATFARLLATPSSGMTTLLRHHLEPPEFRYRFTADSTFRRATGVAPLCAATLPSLTDAADQLHEELLTVATASSTTTVGNHLRRIFDWLADAHGRPTWIERSGCSLAWLPALIDEFDGARFVHLYRNGLDTSRSMAHHPVFRLLLIRRRLERWMGADPYLTDDRTRIDRVPAPWRALLPETFDPVAFTRLDLPLEHFAALWATMEARGLELLGQLDPSRVMHLRYEDLVAAPEQELRRLGDFLGLDARGPGRRWAREAAELVRPATPGHGGEPPWRVAMACEIGDRRFRELGLPI